MDAIIRNFLLSIVIPAVLAGGSFWALSLQTRIPRSWIAFFAGLEASIAIAIGYFLLSGRLPLLPRESTHWLIYVGVVAAIAAALITAFGKPAARVTIMVVAVTLVSFVLVRPLWFSSWKPIQSIWFTGLILAIGTIVWAMLHLAFERPEKQWVMAAIVVIFSCACITVAASGSLSLAQFGGIFTAVIAPLIAIARWRPNSAVLALAIPLSALASHAVLVNARHYSELSLISATLIFLSPAVGWTLARFGPESGVLARGFVQFLAMSLPAAAGAVYALLTINRSEY